MLSLALYHPQIPQNTGTLLRLSSCLGIHLELIRPFGFIFDDKKLRRAGMDYIESADYTIHDSFDEFHDKYINRRLIALEVGNLSISYCDFKYERNDILIVGSEHYGFKKHDLEKIAHRVKIPMLQGRRSLNMAISGAIVVSEAMAQLKLYDQFDVT